MPKKVKYISIFILILVIISCKNDKKNNVLESNTESELKTDSLNGYNELANPDKQETFTVSEYNTDNPEIEKDNKPFVISVNTEIFYLNDFNLSNSFSEKQLIKTLGKPDKLSKDLNTIEETGFPDYSIKYGDNIIWASYGYISNVYLKKGDMKINGIKLGDRRNIIESNFKIDTKTKKYIQIVNSREESLFFKMNESDIITELSYSKLIL